MNHLSLMLDWSFVLAVAGLVLILVLSDYTWRVSSLGGKTVLAGALGLLTLWWSLLFGVF